MIFDIKIHFETSILAIFDKNRDAYNWGVLLILQDLLKKWVAKGVASEVHDFNCKAAQEMTYLADSYATYLQSQRKWKELTDEYQNKKELNVKQTADRIGFRLPQDPTVK